MKKLGWKTADGRVVLFNDMTDSHLSNCIALMERKGHAGHEAHRLMVSELKAREEKKIELIEGPGLAKLKALQKKQIPLNTKRRIVL